MKAYVEYEIPPLRAINWQILEDEPGDPPLTAQGVRDWVEANQPGWNVRKVIVNPAVADLPVHLACNGYDYLPIPDATTTP